MTPSPHPPSLRTEPYRARRTRSLGVIERAGWSVKLIGITADGDLPDNGELEAAVMVAERELPQPARSQTRSATGFVIVHRGAEALWVLVCWWELDIMYERLWHADTGTTDLRPVPPGGPTACVWELLAIDHERRAWIEYVLRRPTAPDFAGYLAAEQLVEEPTA